MSSQLDVSLSRPRRQRMFGKPAVMALLIVCVTVLVFTALVRDSLCELSIRQGSTEIRAFLAYEARE